MSQRGFTLVEMVMIVGVLGIIMVSVSNIMISSFRVKTRVEVADQVEENGTSVLRQLRDNIILATGVGMTCAVNSDDIGSTLSFMNTNDGVVTNLVCYEEVKIASESANGSFDLTSPDVKVTGCNNFAKCELFPDSSDRITQVNLSFTLSSGNTSAPAEQSKTRSFQSSVVPRN
ncbi:type II secretion system protein [Candidatus Shapirobacteria bacterium]|nr:type II secretion system protein [Candidatus Shapirobacteria bacterium]